MHPSSDPSFQPYAFLLEGRPRRLSTSSNEQSPDGSTGHRTPPQRPADCPQVLADTDLTEMHSKHLAQHLEFIVPPRINPVENSELPSSNYCLFLGHLKFETTPADVRWLMKKLCGVTPLKAEFRGNGCCVVYLATESDEMAVRSLNRRVLFDRNGVWFARTAVAVDVLMDYVEKVLPRLGKRGCLRLPRDSLVVEESRSGKKFRRPPMMSTPSPKMPHAFASSPPTPHSLGSPALAGFHVQPPEYALPSSESSASSLNSINHAPPPYSF
jgi:hypothetical protein